MAIRNFRYVVTLKNPRNPGKADYFASQCEETETELKLECINQDGSVRNVRIARDQVAMIEDLGAPKM